MSQLNDDLLFLTVIEDRVILESIYSETFGQQYSFPYKIENYGIEEVVI